jgi:hypothetical protein
MQEGSIGSAITSLDDLATTLYVQKSELTHYANNMGKHVRRVTKTKKDGKPRHIIAPSKKLTTILQRVKTVFFDDYTYPDYVFGLGGNTLKDHATVHAGDNELVQADLTDFFLSIKHTAVYDMWLKHFSLPHEVARILTMLTTFEYRLQQGFATSSHIAAVIAMPLTGELNVHCQANAMSFSQYVDDLNFSGKTIDKRALFKTLISSARANGLSVKKRKTDSFNAQTGKAITGVSTHGSKLRATRNIRQRAAATLKALSAHPQDKLILKSARGYQGYLAHINAADGVKYKAKIDRIILESGY